MREQFKATPQQAHQLLYNLDATPPLPHQLLYALQWVSFTLGIILITTSLVGPGIGLSPSEVIDFGGRVLVVTALATLLQCYFGHGYPIIEGPGAIYWSIYLFTFQYAFSNETVLADIEGGMLVAGLVVGIFALSGLARYSARLFTPAVSGTTLVLISLSLLTNSASLVVGVSPNRPQGDLFHFLVVVTVVFTGSLISVAGRGLIRSLPILVTAVLGYFLFALFGQIDYSILEEAHFFTVPRPLAWGWPAFKPEIAFTYAIAGFLATVNTFAAVEAGATLYGHESNSQRQRAAILWNGVAQMLAGLGAAAGTATLASSTVIISLSRVGARTTVAIAALILLVLGFIPLFSAILATVPLPIVNGIFFLIAANLFALGLDQFTRTRFDTRLRLIVGISILSGLAVTYIPTATFETIPWGGSFLLSNPIIVGTGMAFLGEHLLFGRWTRNFDKI